MDQDIQMDVEESFNSHTNHGLPFNHYAGFPQQATALFSSWPANQPAFGHGIPTSSAPQEESEAQPPPGQAEESVNSTSYPPDASDRTRSESIPAKMHIRRPGKDNWTYLGRVSVYQDLTTDSPIVGEFNPVCLPSDFLDEPDMPFYTLKKYQDTDFILAANSKIVVRSSTNDRVLATFTEKSSICVDKRGNFVVVASVEPAGVVSYSLHAQNTPDALRLLASIELAAYKLGSLSGTENRAQTRLRRKIEKTIREDRKRRHRRRRDDDALVALLDGTTL